MAETREIFDQIGVPAIGMDSKLKLWEGESVQLYKLGGWVNLGEYPWSSQITRDDQISWFFKYQRKMYGIIPVSKGISIPDRPTAGPIWSLHCTNMRMLACSSHLKWKGIRPHDEYYVMHFSWSMLARALSRKHSKSSTRTQYKHYLELIFGWGRLGYAFRLGSFSFEDVKNCVKTIHETALKAKVQLTDYVRLYMASPRMEKTAREYREDLEGKNPKRAKISIEKEKVEAYQAFLPSIDPVDYYARIRKSMDERGRKQYVA